MTIDETDQAAKRDNKRNQRLLGILDQALCEEEQSMGTDFVELELVVYE